jgi:3-deoxy-7-phosphoheptulonate synthase
MLLRLHKGLPQAQVESIHLLCKELGYRTRVVDERPELLALEGAVPHRQHVVRLGDHPGVRDVLDDGGARALVQGTASGPTAVGAARFGAGHVSIIAGPCAVEDEARLLEIARAVRAAGATLLRGGAFKPRTSPYSFQGLGEEGLERLARVKAATGLGVVTEVLDTRDVERVAEVADMLQVGARNMANYALLKELGRARTPVLLKRGFGATVRELLGAAEYVLDGGNGEVILCERGVRGFDDVTRNVLDVGAIAYLKRATHLPVIADPSHAAGRADLVPPLALAGVAAGADGLLIEVHSAPSEARSDADQALGLQRFARLSQEVEALASLDGRRLVRSDERAGGAGTPDLEYA